MLLFLDVGDGFDFCSLFEVFVVSAVYSFVCMRCFLCEEFEFWILGSVRLPSLERGV